MNLVRLGPDRQIEDPASSSAISEEQYEDQRGVFVFSPETTMLMAHERQYEFHAEEWMLNKDMDPHQALIHRDQFTRHYYEHEILGRRIAAAAGAEIIPFPTEYTGSPALQEHLAA